MRSPPHSLLATLICDCRKLGPKSTPFPISLFITCGPPLWNHQRGLKSSLGSPPGLLTAPSGQAQDSMGVEFAHLEAQTAFPILHGGFKSASSQNSGNLLVFRLLLFSVFFIFHCGTIHHVKPTLSPLQSTAQWP